MPFLNVGALALEVVSFRRRNHANMQRTVNARVRNTATHDFSTWEGVVYCEDDAAANAVYAAADPDVDANLTGDAFPVAVPVRAVVEEDDYAPDGADWYRMLSITFHEQG